MRGPVAALFPPSLLAPHDGCAECADLATAHSEAEAVFDRSAAADVRIWMRCHQVAWHRVPEE